jgi:hypothetical protein
MRLGWFPPVRCKSMEAQETRAMLTARRRSFSKLNRAYATCADCAIEESSAVAPAM